MPLSYRTFLRIFGYNTDGTVREDNSSSYEFGNSSVFEDRYSTIRKNEAGKIPRWRPKQVIGVLKQKMATQFNSARKAFRFADMDKNGNLDYEEFKKVLRHYNIEMDARDFTELMSTVDQEGDGKITYQKFMKVVGSHIAGSSDSEGLAAYLQGKQLETSLPIGKEKQAGGRPGIHPHWTASKLEETLADQLALASKSVRATFRKFDEDGSGSLDYKEFRGVLRRYNIEMSDDNFKKVMQKFDLDGSGIIDYREFLERFGKHIAGHADTSGLSAALQEGNVGSNNTKDKERYSTVELRNRKAKNPHWTAKQLKNRLQEALGVSEKSVVSAFLKFDKDRSGSLDYDEMRLVLRKFNIEMDEDNFNTVMHDLDPDRSGYFDYNDFLFHFGEEIAGASDTNGVTNQLQKLQWAGQTATGLPMTENESAGKPGVHPHWTWKQLQRVLSDSLALHSKTVRGAFRRFDRDKSGSLDYGELKCVLRTFNIEMSDENFVEILNHFDPDGSGHIDYQKFLQHFGSGISGATDGPDGLSAKLMDGDSRRIEDSKIASNQCRIKTVSGGYSVRNPFWTAKQVKHAIADHLALSSKSVLKAFKRFDSDHSGNLDFSEFRNVLRRYNIEMEDKNFLEVMREFDTDGSGYVDYKEFLANFGSAIAGSVDGPGGVSAKLLYGDKNGGRRRDKIQTRFDGVDQKYLVLKLPSWKPADVKRILGQKLADKYSSTTHAFRCLDEDKSGHLELKEFRMLLTSFNIEMNDSDFSNLCKSFRIPPSGIPFVEFLYLFGGSISGQADTGWIQGTTSHSYFSQGRTKRVTDPPSDAGTEPGVYDDLSSLAPSTTRSNLSARPSNSILAGCTRFAQKIDNRHRPPQKMPLIGKGANDCLVKSEPSKSLIDNEVPPCGIAEEMESLRDPRTIIEADSNRMQSQHVNKTLLRSGKNSIANIASRKSGNDIPLLKSSTSVDHIKLLKNIDIKSKENEVVSKRVTTSKHLYMLLNVQASSRVDH